MKGSPRVAAGMFLVALSACATARLETDLQGDQVYEVEAAADACCQQELGCDFGTEEYAACLNSRPEYIRSRSAIAGVMLNWGRPPAICVCRALWGDRTANTVVRNPFRAILLPNSPDLLQAGLFARRSAIVSLKSRQRHMKWRLPTGMVAIPSVLALALPAAAQDPETRTGWRERETLTGECNGSRLGLRRRASLSCRG